MNTLEELRAAIQRLQLMAVTAKAGSEVHLAAEFEDFALEVVQVKAQLSEFGKAVKDLDSVIGEELSARFDDDQVKLVGDKVAITRVFRTSYDAGDMDWIPAELVEKKLNTKALTTWMEDKPLPDSITVDRKFSHLLIKESK